MLRTGMKTRLITNAKQRTQNPKSQTEIDNGVHPVHWATSPGPSPMGTDPINSFKNGTNGSGLCKSVQQYWQKYPRPLLWNNTNWLSNQREAK